MSSPLRTTDETLREAFTRRTPLMVDTDPLPKGSLATPLAVVPLVLGDKVVGAIVVATLFPHKSAWAQVDQQLLHLLSSHAASSLVAAHLVQRQSDYWALGVLAIVSVRRHARFRVWYLRLACDATASVVRAAARA